MLPTGAVLLVVSTLAVPALVTGAALAAVHGAVLVAGWCLLAATVALWNAVRAIAVLSAFDWRPLPGIAARTALAAVAWPGWWR